MPTTRAARLHGIRDLRVEEVEVADPGPDEVLVRVEACGICPTDIRKFHVGLNDGSYPFNPGHEWVGRIEALGSGVPAGPGGFAARQRVYGDVYGGYAGLVVLPVRGNAWSAGPVPVPDDLPLERAVFVEPLADCLHAVLDQGRVVAGSDLLVVGAGQMGLQMAAVGARAGAKVVAADPLPDRRDLSLQYGAAGVLDPASAPLAEQTAGPAFDAIVLTVARAASVPELLPLLRPGGVLVLFAGFGGKGEVSVDLDDVHYRELTIVGSEWVGTPPNQRLDRYREALDLLVAGGPFALESLVTGTATFDTLAAAFDDVGAHRGLKYVLDTRE